MTTGQEDFSLIPQNFKFFTIIRVSREKSAPEGASHQTPEVSTWYHVLSLDLPAECRLKS